MDGFDFPTYFRIGVYDSLKTVPHLKNTPPRIANLFELELPIEQGGIAFIDDSSTPITTNTVICAKPGQIRHTILPYKCFFVRLEIKEGKIYEVLKKIPSQFLTFDYEKYKEIFSDLYKYYSIENNNNELILYSLLLKLIYQMQCDTLKVSDTENKSQIISNNYVIEKAIAFIDNNYNRNLTLEEIAEHVCFSPVYFHNKFKTATGKTPHEYITQKRIAMATNLLITSNLTMSQIAYSCGFSSQSYFNFAFKKQLDVTPKTYIRNYFKKNNIF